MTIEILLNDGSSYTPSPEQVDKWKELYPSVDVDGEIRAMAGWADANPKKRKTKRGAPSFANSWLARAQDKGGSKQPQKRNNLREMEMHDMLTDISWVDKSSRESMKVYFLSKYGQYFLDGVRHYE